LTLGEMNMKKFTYTVELVHDDIDSNTICEMLNTAVDGIAEYQCVEHTGVKPLTEQGLKVWTKRKVGVSLAVRPAPKKKVSEKA